MTTKKAYLTGLLIAFLWLVFFALLLVCLSSCGTEPGIANTVPELPVNDVVIINHPYQPEIIIQGRKYLPVVYRAFDECGEVDFRLACSTDGTIGLMILSDDCAAYGAIPLSPGQTGVFCGDMMDREPPVNPRGPDPLPEH